MGTTPRSVASLAIAALSATLLAGCSLQQDVGSRSDLAGRGRAAPPVVGSTLGGGRFDSLAVRGHPLVLDFWASWCGPCRAEQPELNALHSRFAGRGVQFMGVDMRDDDASATAFRADLRVPYPTVTDPSAQISASFDVAAPPEIVVVDGGGHVAGRFLGTTVGVADVLGTLLGTGRPAR